MRTLFDRLVSRWEQVGAAPLTEALQTVSRPSGTAAPPTDWPLLSLPGLCCAAAGGDPCWADDVAAAWGMLYLAAHWLDSVADGESPEGERGTSVTLAAAAMASASLALDELERSGADSESVQAIRTDFYRTVLRSCAGQVADLALAEPSLERCWQIAEARTGLAYALACRSGARLATADRHCIRLFGQFGLHLGILVQIGDDLGGLWTRNGRGSDLARGKWSLPVAYAMAVASPPERGRLRRCLNAVRADPTAERATRRAIIESGAMLYLVAEAERHRCRAGAALMKAARPGHARNELFTLLSQAVPLRDL